MTKLLEFAIEAAKELSSGEQDQIAAMIFAHLPERHNSLLTPEQIAEVERRLADPDDVYVPLDGVMARLRQRFG